MAMWISPFELVQAFVDGVRRDLLVEDLNRMSDHLLDDIGLRRDQLDLLRFRPAAAKRPTLRSAPQPVVRPSLQGCG